MKWKNRRNQSMPPVMYNGGDQHEGYFSHEVYSEKPSGSDTSPQIYTQGRRIVVCDHRTRLVGIAVVKTLGYIERLGTRGGAFKAKDPTMLISMVGDP